MLSQITALALSLGAVVSGAVLVEVIFNYPGLGSLLYEGVRSEDYVFIQRVTLLLSISLAWFLFLIDVLYPLIDPRISR